MIWLSTALDVVTDLFLIAFPLCIITWVPAPTSGKVITCIIFIGARLTVVIAVVRATISSRDFVSTRILSLNFWAAIECPVALILNNLISLRQQQRVVREARSRVTATRSSILSRSTMSNLAGRLASRWSNDASERF